MYRTFHKTSTHGLRCSWADHRCCCCYSLILRGCGKSYLRALLVYLLKLFFYTGDIKDISHLF